MFSRYKIPVGTWLFGLIIFAILLESCRVRIVPKNELPYYNTPDFTPLWLDSKSADTVHTIPDFNFTDQQGQKVTRASFEGKITVVDFFFTSCPGICKKLADGMEKVQAAYKADDEVRLLSHSVTPDRDNVAVLKRYAEEHNAINGKWSLVTGARNEIYKIARTAYFADEDMGWKQDSTTFLHTENILLIDKQHHIRGIYKGTIPLQITDLIADIKKLEQER